MIRSDYKETAPRREDRLTPINLQSPRGRVLGQNRRVSPAGKNQDKGFPPMPLFFRCPRSCHCPAKSHNGQVTVAWLVRWGLGTARPQHETLQVTSLAGILHHGTGQKNRLDNSSSPPVDGITSETPTGLQRGCVRSWNLLMSPGLQGRLEGYQPKKVTSPSGKGLRRGHLRTF